MLFKHSPKGQGAVEYIIILLIVAFLVVGILMIVGPAIRP